MTDYCVDCAGPDHTVNEAGATSVVCEVANFQLFEEVVSLPVMCLQGVAGVRPSGLSSQRCVPEARGAKAPTWRLWLCRLLEKGGGATRFRVVRTGINREYVQTLPRGRRTAETPLELVDCRFSTHPDSFLQYVLYSLSCLCPRTFRDSEPPPALAHSASLVWMREHA